MGKKHRKFIERQGAIALSNYNLALQENPERKRVMTDNNWWKNGIIYQIYPRSFQDSGNDGIGDIPGITDRLAYLADLGIDAIWLSPIYPSPDVDFGYDVSDYCDIDPKFGRMEDFERLVENAHRYNIRIILDLVLNHSSDQHPWFVQSRSSRNNAFRDWYLWRDPNSKGGPPNNWQSVFGGPGWEWDEPTGQYYFHMFYKQQPDLNWRNPAVREALLNVFRFWCEKGVDGFRLDVFNAYFKHAEFPNNPSKIGLRGFDRQEHIYDVDQPELIPLLQDIRKILDAYPQRYAVGETFLGSAGRAEKYCQPGLLHATFNFDLAHARWNAAKMKKAVLGWENSLPRESWPTQVLNNHDVKRSATRFSRDENDDRLKMAALMLLTLRGTPYLYYGEEIGMRDIPISRKQILDPIGKRFWPFYIGRDGCRSPMQWDADDNAGFSQTQPWLPVHQNYPQRNVEKQQQDAGSLLNFYKAVIRLRRDQPALQCGDFRALELAEKDVFAYLRRRGDEALLVVLNFSARRLEVTLDSALQGCRLELLLSSRRAGAAAMQAGRLSLEAQEGAVWKVEK